MTRTKLLVLATAIAVPLGLLPVHASAQQPDTRTKKATPRAAGAADQLVLRVYNVSDLVLPTPNYSFRGTVIPTLLRGESSLESVGSIVGGGAAGGGLGGFGFGGMPQFPGLVAPSTGLSHSGAPRRGSALAQVGGGDINPLSGASQPGPAKWGSPGGAGQSSSPRFDIETLKQVLMRTVDAETWVAGGGHGSLEVLGTLLVIQQTPATHEKIVEFLAGVRQAGGSLRPVTVQAYWISTDAHDTTIGDLKKAGTEAVRQVPRAMLEKLTAGHKTVRSQVTCFEGQTVHIISGRSHTISEEGNPVVAAGAVAFDPQLSHLHTGALLQITPTLAFGGKSAILDLWTVFSEWSNPEHPVEVQAQVGATSPGAKEPAAASVKLDRLKLLAQQFSTTVRMPLDQPVLVGGMTLDPGQENSPGLYLVVEVTAAEESK